MVSQRSERVLADDPGADINCRLTICGSVGAGGLGCAQLSEGRSEMVTSVPNVLRGTGVGGEMSGSARPFDLSGAGPFDAPFEMDALCDFGGAPEMVIVPVGQFRRGSHFIEDESPIHSVVIPRPLAIGRYPVTFDEWQTARMEGAELPEPNGRGWGLGRRPVINVSWLEAQAYCAWLSKVSGRTYRLPSEAEWEYCCRAGSITDYAFGDHVDERLAHFSARMFQNPRSTSEVGSYPPNAWGIFDMHGNVWEWCQDNWHDSYRGAPRDGSVWGGGDARLRVLRGGAWTDEREFLRSSVRAKAPFDRRDRHIGFRVVRELE
jgi:formylglycine-generating enzyme required for sulfatase activity